MTKGFPGEAVRMWAGGRARDWDPTSISRGLVVLTLFVWVRGSVSPTELALLSAFGLVLAVVCLLACLGPAHRAVSVHPSRSLGSSE